MENTGNYYTINHMALITGLTDRTIRSYIASGLLQGEKINGIWHFTPEQADAFLRHPAVLPSIQAKKNALVYDFLLDTKKPEPEICMILDLPGANQKETAEYFCYTISNGRFPNIQFSFDSTAGNPRVILKGDAQTVLALVDGYYSR